MVGRFLCLIGFHRLHFQAMMDRGDVMWCERCGKHVFRRYRKSEIAPD